MKPKTTTLDEREFRLFLLNIVSNAIHSNKPYNMRLKADDIATIQGAIIEDITQSMKKVGLL